MDVSLIGMGAGKAVLETVEIAAHGHAFGKAPGRAAVARPDLAFHGLLSTLFRDDVHHAADGVGTVKHGSRALDDFDAFDTRGVDEHG